MWNSCIKLLGLALASALPFAFSVSASDAEAKQRIRSIREIAREGSGGIPRIVTYLSDADTNVRVEAVKALTDVGTDRSLDPLIKATADNDAEVQIHAVDGLVNFYLPGYVRTGVTAPLRRAGTAIKGRFTDTNDQVIESWLQVRPDVIDALGRIVTGGSSMESRAAAARGLGILRGRSAVPQLIEALHSKDDQVMYESLVALQKIRDREAGPRIQFALRDLNERVQIAAIETTGLLQNRAAENDLRDVLDRSRNAKVRHAALSALAMMPGEATHTIFQTYLTDKDEGMRTGAAEGIARLKDPADKTAIEKAYAEEKKSNARLAMAFALVSEGRLEVNDTGPLSYLVAQLTSHGYHNVAQAYLTELARDPAVRTGIYGLLQGQLTKDEKIGIAQILAASGDRDAIQYLEWLSKDPDAETAEQGVRALRSLHARIG